jgi:hypothetical protein
VSETFGIRFGKVKTPTGLFNETQDIDPSYNWALLPQSVYDVATRNADLAHYGGVVYGSLPLGKKWGKLDVRGWGGEAVIPTDDGQFDDLREAGNGPQNSFNYPLFGGALHWRTPIRGLMVGASDSRANQASVALTGGTESFSAWNNLSYFGQYTKGNAMFAAEWNRQAGSSSLNLTGSPADAKPYDSRGWYAMATYKLKEKLTVGAYDSQYFELQQPRGADRYSKDWAVSGRYDVTQFLYLKAEQHFIQGTALSFTNALNPDPRPTSRLTALKIGVSF